MEYRINLLICESTIATIDNTIELSLCMESETEVIMDPFSIRDILPPREFNFIAVAIDLR